MHKEISIWIFGAALIAGALALHTVIAGPNGELAVHFLDVGQGDSHFIEFPSGAQMLIDGGPSGAVLSELADILPVGDRYIDLVLLTHTDADHLSGLLHVLQRYDVGLFLFNGRGAGSDVWKEFENIINEYDIPAASIKEGDVIRHGGATLTVLSPGREIYQSALPNDAALVLLMEADGIKTLFASDIGFVTEKLIEEKYDIDVDILKVAHHGSKHGSGELFLAEATPYVAIVQSGKNRYGHPTSEALARLRAAGARVYRNDLHGTVSLIFRGRDIEVTTER